MQLAAQFWETDDRYLHMAFDLAGYLAKVHLRDEEVSGFPEFTQSELRKWPDGPQP
jgi:hypothetical protein